MDSKIESARSDVLFIDNNIPQKNTSVNTKNEKSLKNVPKFSINVDKSNSANYNESEQYGVMWTLESGVLNKKKKLLNFTQRLLKLKSKITRIMLIQIKKEPIIG